MEWGDRQKKIVAVGLAGAVVVLFSLLVMRMNRLSGEMGKLEVVVTPTSGVQKNSWLMVEAAGEVANPGVYQLLADSRVGELIASAGGMTVKADKDWVAKNINQAAKLADGQKIYIPKVGEPAVAGEKTAVNQTELININTATVAELDRLWGIGEATAKNIVAGRPYKETNDLLTKKIIKSNVWEKIKGEITI